MRKITLAAVAALLSLAAAGSTIETADARPGRGNGHGWGQRSVSHGPPPWAPAWGYRARQRGIHPGRAAHERRLIRRQRVEMRGDWSGRWR